MAAGDEERVNGFALFMMETMAVAHSSGIVVANEQALDDDVWADFDSRENSKQYHANEYWWAVEF